MYCSSFASRRRKVLPAYASVHYSPSRRKARASSEGVAAGAGGASPAASLPSPLDGSQRQLLVEDPQGQVGGPLEREAPPGDALLVTSRGHHRRERVEASARYRLGDACPPRERPCPFYPAREPQVDRLHGAHQRRHFTCTPAVVEDMRGQLDGVDHSLARSAVARKAERLTQRPERPGVVSAIERDDVSPHGEDQCKQKAVAGLLECGGRFLEQSLRVGVLAPGAPPPPQAPAATRRRPGAARTPCRDRTPRWLDSPPPPCLRPSTAPPPDG